VRVSGMNVHQSAILSMSTQTIYLIRHTAVDLKGRYFYGRTDVGLKETFPQEVERIRRVLPATLEFPFWASPLSRCRRLADALEINYNLDDRLMELDFGDWEMKEFADIPDEERNHYLANFTTVIPPGGEGYLKLQERSVELLKEVVAHEAPVCGIVAHSGVIRSMVCHVMGLPLEHTYRFGLDYGSVTTLVKDWKGLRVDRLNH